MVKGSATPSDGSPATAGGSPLAGSDPADQRLIAMTMEVGRTVQFDEDGQDQESENGDASEGEYAEKAETAELGETKTTAELLGEVEELTLQVGRMGAPRPVERNLSAELDEGADDEEDEEEHGVAQGDRPPLIPKATRNADTPSANKVLARLGEEMRTRSEWMMMFAPVAMAQAKWPMLGPELTQPVRAANINQLVEETVLLLKAMGYRCNSRPNSLILSDWIDLILGTDFMIPAGIRLDLYNSAVKLPDEMVIPLIPSSNAPTKTEFGPNVPCGPPDGLTIESRMTAEFKLPRRQPILANEGYVRVNSAKYRDWQILAFESAMDEDLLQKEQRLYEDWLSHQPPAVERRKYPVPTAVEKRPPPVENGPELTCAERWRRIEADTEAGDDERRRGNADVISTSGVTRGDPAINSAFKLEDVRADRTPVQHDGQDVSYQLSKFEDDGVISDVNTNSAVEGTSAVRAKEDVSATEDSAITEGGLEERSEHALRDAQPVMDNRAKFGVIRQSIVGKLNSAVSTLTTISAGSNHVVTANSALGDPAAGIDLGAVPACHRTADYVKDECGRVDVCPAVVADSAVQCPSLMTANSRMEVLLSRDVEDNSEGLSWTVKTSNHSDEGEARAEYRVDGWSSAAVVNSAMGTPKACIIQSTAVDSASADLNAESDSDAATACLQDVSYTGKKCAFTEVSPAVPVNSADQHYDTTEYYNGRKVLLSRDVEDNSEGLSWTANTKSNSDEGEARAESGVEELSSAAVVNSAMGTQKACIIQSAAVDSASEDLNTESVSDVVTACRQDVSYTEDAFARTEVSSSVTTTSADEHSNATKDHDSREVLLLEGVKPNDDPATADSALETMEAETGSEVVRQHDDDTIYLGDKFEHAGVRSAIAVNSANTGPDADDTYDLSEVSLLRGTGTEIGVTSSATMVFDPGGIGYRLERAVDEETASQNAGHVSGTDPKTVTELATAELNWEDDECNESLKYLAPPFKNSATVRMSPALLYARIPADFAGCVLSFDGSAKTAKYGGYGSCSWILWRLPNWDIEIAASAYLSSTTVNIAEYTGMNNGVLAAIDRGITDLIIVGDSRLAIQQSMGVIACKKETLQVELA
ncbi:hypothetical protein PInf_011611 [Phytophthora infestans]|nr:hypothetical protein PInf_011611 [Phytophthora infestans]